jgi:hypothetical protein
MHSEQSANAQMWATLQEWGPRIGQTFHIPAPVRPRLSTLRRILRALRISF